MERHQRGKMRWRVVCNTCSYEKNTPVFVKVGNISNQTSNKKQKRKEDVLRNEKTKQRNNANSVNNHNCSNVNTSRNSSKYYNKQQFN